MVVSKINSSIEYEDTTKVETSDKKTNKDIYILTIFGVECLITIGNLIEKGNTQIVYFPIYLIKYNNKVLQIGLYEFKKESITLNIFEDDNILDYITPIKPLLYSFVDRDFLLKLYLSPEHYQIIQENKYTQQQQQTQEQTQEQKQEQKQLIESMFKNTTLKTPITTLIKETEDDNKKYIQNFSSARNNNNYWVQQFMSNIHYGFQENEGSGDCFFATIRDAFKSIGKSTTVANLRQLVANEMNENIYTQYKTLYDNTTEQYNANKLQYKHEHEKYQNNTTLTRDEKNKLKNKLNELKEDMKYNISNINEYKFMKEIHSTEDLKNYVKTSSYWADEWAISKLEILLRVKFIILKRNMFNSGDNNNVLQCQSGSIDESIENSSSFNPKYYIMVDYNGQHYELITYKNKRIFTFDEIPFGIKILISDKCMEKMSGIYKYINDFANFNKEYGRQRGGNNSRKHAKCDGQIMEELYQYGHAKLWDDDVKILFYSNSSDVPCGKAQGEKIPSDKMKKYLKLNKIKKWRRKLDNYWVQPFTLDGKIWASVEHYVEAYRFKHIPKIYEKFTLDSKSSLSKNPSKIKQFVKMHQDKLNEDYDDKQYCINMYSAQEAKFTQHDDLKELLLATSDANLFHHVKGSPPIQYTNLMIIRKKERHSSS